MFAVVVLAAFVSAVMTVVHIVGFVLDDENQTVHGADVVAGVLICVTLVLAAGSYKLDRQLSAHTREINEINEQVLAIERRAQEVQRMVLCINTALDSTMNDLDQVLTIGGCVRDAGFRDR